MTSKSKDIALQATFQTFVSCYVREIPSNQEWKKENIDGVETDCLHLYLTHNQTHYCIELLYQSIVGPHQYGRTFSKKDTESLVEIDRLTMLIAIMQELHFISNDQSITELIGRVFESMSNMTKMIEKKLASSTNQDLLTYLSQEKSLHYGHWLHPTPKSRQGMSDWLLHQYSPELHGAFQLHYFAIKRTMIEEYSTLSMSAGQFIIEELKNSRNNVPPVDLENYLIVPMHPLQAQNLLHQAYVQKAIERNDVLDLGRLGDEYHATSSIRTVYSPSRHWMYKFSLPVKITNSLRVNKLHELRAGVVVSDLIHSLPLHSTYSSFEIIHDPAYIRVKFPEMEEESGWEVILRENIFRGEEGKGVTLLAGLVQDPLPGNDSVLHTILKSLATKEDSSLEYVAIKWLEHYWKIAIEPLIHLYDEYGIALEAHQQNSLVNVLEGYPSRYYFRDNQGYYLSSSRKNTLQGYVEGLQRMEELFYDDDLIQNRFTYYILFNHIFSIIYRLGKDGILQEEWMLNWLKEKLVMLETELKDLGKKFVQKILNEKTLPQKANLLTRVYGIDELSAELEQAVYVNIRNPIALGTKGEPHVITM